MTTDELLKELEALLLIQKQEPNAEFTAIRFTTITQCAEVIREFTEFMLRAEEREQPSGNTGELA